MATQIPPATKKQRRQAQAAHADVTDIPVDLPQVRIRLEATGTGEKLPQSLRVPGNSTVAQLELLVNQLLNNEDSVPYEFALQSVDGSAPVDITHDLYTDILRPHIRSTEDELVVMYTPRAVFRVRNITRSTGVAMGHGATILTAQFAPYTATRAVTGAGDCTARLWNSDSGTPIKTLSGHTDHVLAAQWSPDGSCVATAGKDSRILVWDSKTGEPVGRPLTGHAKFVTQITWEPLHLVPENRKPRLASASKDGTVRVWDVETGQCQFALNGHTSSVSCIRWGGQGHIFSGSHDKLLKVWDSNSGRLVSTHKAHAHWINHIALSTDFALRSGPFGPTALLDTAIPSVDASAGELRQISKIKYEQALTNSGGTERVVTASDDFTMFLWDPLRSAKPLGRLTGHQKLVNHVCFSPDSRTLASASFDNSVKLWDGVTGKFLASLRGHVAAVYQCAWSADSRLLVSCSKDTTIKIWDAKTRKLKSDLPGHKDEVYAVDWSVDGTKVCSGSRDKTVRFWSH